MFYVSINSEKHTHTQLKKRNFTFVYFIIDQFKVLYELFDIWKEWIQKWAIPFSKYFWPQLGHFQGTNFEMTTTMTSYMH